MKGKDKYNLFPCVYLFRSAAFDAKNIVYYLQNELS
jgi:hypothetical protein